MEEKQKINENQKENGFVAWIKEHKKQLIIAGISIPTLFAIVFGIKNRDSLIDLWDDLKEEIEKANLYSSKWFANATDEELSAERECVRLAYCAAGENFNESCRLWNLLQVFNKEQSKRGWGDRTPCAPSIHREHGWYLPNDD